MKATEFFEARLAFQTDVSDVAKQVAKHVAKHGVNQAVNQAANQRGDIRLVDTRNDQAWDQGHIPGAIRLADLADDDGTPVVTYCWGPGCNGATKAALALAQRGYDVREMIGGIEYWIREGFPTATKDGEWRQEPDPLTAPACGC